MNAKGSYWPGRIRSAILALAGLALLVFGGLALFVGIGLNPYMAFGGAALALVGVGLIAVVFGW